MPHVLIISPDRMTLPVGGLGVHIGNVLESIVAIEDDLSFDVMTWDEGHDIEHHPRVKERRLSPMHLAGNVGSSTITVARDQARIVQRALKLPRRPDIVHANDWSTFDAGRILADLYNVPLVTSLHLSVEDLWATQLNKDTSYEQAIFMQYGGLACSTITAMVSNHYNEEYRFACGGPTVIVGNGVDALSFERSAALYKMPGSRPRKVCYIGRFSSMKNVSNLMRAPLPEDVDLVVAGGTDASSSGTMSEIESLCDERRHVVGPLYGDEKISFMRSAHAGVFPSIREPFGIAGLEWMASGVPLVATFAGGMNDYLEEDLAVRCDTTPESIGRAIREILSMDDGRRSAMTRKAADKARSKSWESVAKRYLTLYDMALTTRRVHPLEGLGLSGMRPPSVLSASYSAPA